MADAPLRIGILCEELLMQRWQLECLRQLQDVPGVEFAVVVVRDGGGGKAATAPLDRLAYLRTFLYRRWREGRSKPKAMDTLDASPLIGGVPRLACSTEVRKGAEHFSEKDIERIRSRAPDILLRFGFNIVRGSILDLPRHGVWSFHHGDELKYRGGPPGLWEIMYDDPVTGAILQRLTGKLDGGHVLRKGWFRTIDHSLKETVDTVMMHSAVWPALMCREILAGDHQAAVGTLSGTTAPIFKYPGNVEFLFFLWKQFRNKLRFHRDELGRHEEWNIGVLHQPIASLLEERPSLNVRWLPPPGIGQFRADPFGYMVDGQLNTLYEKYDRNEAKGTIARIRPKRDNNLKRSRTMLQADGHLSYPFTLEVDRTVFVVPEQADTGKVELYRLDPDNESLARVCVLLEEALFDPTLLLHQGRWWMFGTKAPLTNVELFIYHSDRLEGPFIPHALNPVKADIRSARPGGTPFVHQGQLWRPAQDSSSTYGGRIAMNRITLLTPEGFSEETIKYIEPMKGQWAKGLHTLSAVGDITLMDGKRFITDAKQREQARKRKLQRLAKGRSEATDEEEDDNDDL